MRDRMNITTLKGPVTFAADIERQVYVTGTPYNWRTSFQPIWDSIGLHHYIVATQLNEELAIQHYESMRQP